MGNDKGSEEARFLAALGKTDVAISERIAKHDLSPKEKQIADLLVTGLSNKEIGYIVRHSEQVVKNYIRKMYLKAGIHSRVSFAFWWSKKRQGEK